MIYTEPNECSALEIIHLYLGGLTLGSLSSQFRMAEESIKDILIYHRIPIREANDLTKKPMKEDFFENIDRADKAYMLGWFYSDGNVSQDLKVAKISVLNKDDDIIKKLSELVYYEPTYVLYRKYINLSIHRKKMATDLVRLGCVPNKSLILRFPTEQQVPNRWLPDFIRGYFDGDGSFYSHRCRGGLAANICSTRPFCERLAEVITEANENITYSIEDINDKGSAVIRFACFSAIRLGDYMYSSGSDLRLNRKYTKWYNGLLYQRDKVYIPKRKWIKDKAPDVYEIIDRHVTKDSLLTQ